MSLEFFKEYIFLCKEGFNLIDRKYKLVNYKAFLEYKFIVLFLRRKVLNFFNGLYDEIFLYFINLSGIVFF
jgi:hypothetical protein